MAKTLGVYVAIVGSAVTMLLGILRAGERLRAPRALAGVWQLTVEPTAAGAACLRALPLTASELTIRQSGVHLQVGFNDAATTTFASRLRGTR